LTIKGLNSWLKCTRDEDKITIIFERNCTLQ
jgi:hypothetical protein